ncbi:hypothetical protein VZT92_023676 [Zoarces viviparus]|uniref:Ribonuclease A-domain domain-containing protein n=1 Tax=Zoarces viviparus TaxID=48416 RepID=A0AAW1E870_ZOAVI
MILQFIQTSLSLVTDTELNRSKEEQIQLVTLPKENHEDPICLYAAAAAFCCCARSGERRGRMTTSNFPFSIIVCELNNQGARRPRCQYSGKRLTRRITIECENGLPVHYAGDIVHFEN